MHPSLWLMDFGQIFREVPEYVHCSLVHSRSLKFLCIKDAKSEPFTSVVFHTGFLYGREAVILKLYTT